MTKNKFKPGDIFEFTGANPKYVLGVVIESGVKEVDYLPIRFLGDPRQGKYPYTCRFQKESNMYFMSKIKGNSKLTKLLFTGD